MGQIDTLEVRRNRDEREIVENYKLEGMCME